MNNIYLTGMPGSGKSTAARLIFKYTGFPALDLDRIIEKRTGKNIPEIFKEYGEDYFRLKEREILSICSLLNRHIIACGGGIILDPRNIAVMRQSGSIFFIDRPLSFLLKMRLTDRPLISGPHDIEKLYRERINLYRSTADFTVSENSIREIAEFIAHHIKKSIP